MASRQNPNIMYGRRQWEDRQEFVGPTHINNDDVAVTVYMDTDGEIVATHRDGREWSGVDVFAVLQRVVDAITTGLIGIQAGEYLGYPQHIGYDPGTPRQYDMGVKFGEDSNTDIGIVGEGMRQTRLKWADDAENVNGLTMIYANGYMGLTLADMTLDGNIDNVGFVETDGCGGILTGGEDPEDSGSATVNRHGAVYRNLEFVDQPGSGLYSGFHDGGYDVDARFDNLIARNCAMPGVHLDFPHSSTATNIVCDSCGTDWGSNDWALSISGPGDANNGNWRTQDFEMSGVSVYGGGWVRIYGVYGVSVDGFSVHADGDLDQLWAVSVQNATDLDLGVNQIERINEPSSDTQGITLNDNGDVSVHGGHIRADRCFVFSSDGTDASVDGTTFVPTEGGRSIVCFADAEGQFTGCTLDDENGADWTMSLASAATMTFSGVRCTSDSPGTVVNSGADVIHEGTRNLGLSVASTETQSGDSSGGVTSFDIAHDLAREPTDVNIVPQSADAAGDWYWDASNTDDDNIRIEYATAPPDGTDNLTWWYEAKI